MPDMSDPNVPAAPVMPAVTIRRDVPVAAPVVSDVLAVRATSCKTLFPSRNALVGGGGGDKSLVRVRRDNRRRRRVRNGGKDHVHVQVWFWEEKMVSTTLDGNCRIGYM